MATLMELIESREREFKEALGVKRDFRSWFSVARSWIEKTEGKLPYKEVGGREIVAAFKNAAKLGLMIDGEECMVMIRGKRTPVIRCEIGYLGIIRMAGQAGALVNARTIYEGDAIELDEGMGFVKHTPAWLLKQEPGEPLGYYAVATYKDGRRIVRSISKAEVDKLHSTNSDVWKSHGDRMGEKTAILQLRKVLHLGDGLEEVLSSSGVGFDTGEEPYAPGDDEPQHPTKTTQDKVLAAARRAEQDKAAEDSSFDVGDDPI